jgi:hypothetical protein
MLTDNGLDTERALSIQIAIHLSLVSRPFASAPGTDTYPPRI